MPVTSLHFKLAIRQLEKSRSFSLLNILGLTLGLTTFLLIVLYVADDLSFDRWNPNADRIIRPNADLYSDGRLSSFAGVSPIVAPTLLRDYPEVEAAARCLREDDTRFRMGNQDQSEHHVASVDPSFFKLFPLAALDGDAVRGLDHPHTAVLTASTANRYFNTTRAVGRTLTRLDDSILYSVVAVVADLPRTSSFQYDIFLSLHGTGIAKGANWYALYPMSTFVLLRPGADRAAFDKKLAGLMGKYDKDYSAMEKDNGGKWWYHIGETPLTAIHLHSHRADELGINSDIQYVYIFSAIGVFVLLIAGINFMNLSTARSANRAREVGVRKVLGSARSALIAQFLSESLVLTAVAAILAIGLTRLFLPAFNDLAGKEIAFNAATLRWLLPAAAGITLALGLLAGAWPAFFLLAFTPVQVLNSKGAIAGNGGSLRNLLVVGQFGISIFLIVGTGVVYRQLQFIQHRDPGYSRSQLLLVKDMEGMSHPEILEQQIKRLAGVTGVTGTDFTPTSDRRWHNWGTALHGAGHSVETQLWIVDPDYIPTMGMQLVTGRNFSTSRPTDTTAIIINEAAARQFGIARDPLGKTIRYAAYMHGQTDFTVIGVVKDFNFSSVRTSVLPLVLTNTPADVPPAFSIRIAPGHVPDVLTRVKQLFTVYAPAIPFHYSFMDADFDALYTAEQRMGTVTLVLTALAIAIACLGLFGLAAYAAEQRAKEIGIRKILGADIPSIVILLSKDFGRLIALALLIATPIAAWAMHRWLENFAYRTTVTPWLFAAAAGIILLAAALTTLFQSLKAAVANPIDALRSE
jgi:putative ABC transport system permease protein